MLNAQLYHLLKHRFGQVRIANEGQADQITANGRVGIRGEQYRVCCPYCFDTRYRLYISYRWSPSDRATRNSAYCHNEHCDLRDLAEDLKPYVGAFKGLVVTGEGGHIGGFRAVNLPGACVPLSELPGDHPAVRYVVQRGFDPRELVADWGVQFCTDHPSSLIGNRLIIPFNWEDKLVGWQARAIGLAEIKYYTMPGLQKNRILYNGDRAARHGLCVLVEGVFDAMRVGTNAVALLGTSLSTTQAQIIKRCWRAACVLLDADAADKAEKIVYTLRSHGVPATVVTLPVGDPADYSRKELDSLIAVTAGADHETR